MWRHLSHESILVSAIHQQFVRLRIWRTTIDSIFSAKKQLLINNLML